MREKDWRELFAVETEQEERRGLATDIAEAHDHPACRRARGFKCVCGCHGAYHGSYWAERNHKLDQWSEDLPHDIVVLSLGGD